MFAFVLCQIPGVLEGSAALRAVKRSFSGVSQLVSPDVRRAGERLAACFAGESFPSSVWLRLSTARIRLSGFLLLCVSSWEKFDGSKNLISAGGRRRERCSRETSV